MDALAKAYFQKFLVRVEVLPEYQKREAYSDVVRESQEALELFIKGLLRTVGAAPSHTHDPGKELAAVERDLPEVFRSMAGELTTWSRALRRERELSYYGAADFIPTEEYDEKEAATVIAFLERVAAALKTWLAGAGKKGNVSKGTRTRRR